MSIVGREKLFRSVTLLQGVGDLLPVERVAPGVAQRLQLRPDHPQRRLRQHGLLEGGGDVGKKHELFWGEDDDSWLL